jgi:uncharacterized secreted repeat protein (TIGR03808 family)
MPIDRRRFFAGAAAVLPLAAVAGARAAPQNLSILGREASEFGVRANASEDQSATIQRAIDMAASRNQPLAFAPGTYRIARLNLPSGAQLLGVRGATRFLFAGGPSLLESRSASYVTLSGLTFDGQRRALPDGHGLLHFENARNLKIADCELLGAGGDALRCIGAQGEIVDNTIIDSDTAIHSLDARGLIVSRNTIANIGNNGIQIWRNEEGEDGSIVSDNRIERVANSSGGSGQYGNAVNVFRAGNVIVRGNRIAHCAFSAVRGNAASNLHIEGNAITDAREVALYAEFGFEGAAITGNIVDGAAIGISVTNFNRGGRLAAVQGNIIRNLLPKRPSGTDAGDGAGIGISVEADTAVTGNTVENAPFAGMMLGFGAYLRDVAATGNVIRRAGIGIGVSVAAGAGPTLIANNMIGDVVKGAVVGMDRNRIVTGDLMRDGANTYRHLTIAGNNFRASPL